MSDATTAGRLLALRAAVAAAEASAARLAAMAAEVVSALFGSLPAAGVAGGSSSAQAPYITHRRRRCLRAVVNPRCARTPLAAGLRFTPSDGA